MNNQNTDNRELNRIFREFKFWGLVAALAVIGWAAFCMGLICWFSRNCH